MARNRRTSLVDRLRAEAAQLHPRDVRLTMPLHVLLGEAIEVARFCAQNWKPSLAPVTKTPVHPGLQSAGKHLARSIADEILALHRLVGQAQTAYRLALAPPTDDSIARARLVRSELSSALRWLFSTSHAGVRDARLAAIVQAHRDDPDTSTALASELADYAGLATLVENDLAELGAFDTTIIAEATLLVIRLRERSANRTRHKTDAAALLNYRNRLASLLLERMSRVRAAARHVFRHHDALVKQVTSSYQRHRIAHARRRTIALAK